MSVKVRKTQLLFGNIARIALMTSALMFGDVQGDVFELQVNMRGVVPVAFLNAGQFRAFIRGNPDALPGGAIDPFVNGAAAATQMLGYAVFFPNGAIGAQQVYVAKKRQALPVSNNNPANGGHIFNFSFNMHTERQLTVVTLGNALGANINLPAIQAGAQSANAVSMLARIALTVPGAAARLNGGTLHVYTEFPPCRQPAQDNRFFSCINYYMALAAIFNVQFNIYYRDARMDLNGHFIHNPTNIQAPNNPIPAASFALLDAISSAGLLGLPNVGGAVGAANAAFANRVQIINNPDGAVGGFLLQYSNNNGANWTSVAHTVGRQVGGTVWNNPDGAAWNHIGSQARIQTLVRTLRNVLPALTQQQRNNIFNTVHNYGNIPNINFIAI